MEKVKMLCLMLVSFSLVHSSRGQIISPCPDVFLYQNNGIEWSGVITVPSENIGDFLRLSVFLSLVQPLPTRYEGHVDILGDRTDIFMNVMYANPIKYKVTFPVQTDIPSIRSIVFNGLTLCEFNDRKANYMIELKHELYTRKPESDFPKRHEVIANSNNIQHAKKPLFYEIISQVFDKKTRSSSPSTTVRNNYSVSINSNPIINTMTEQEERPNPDSFARPSSPDSEKPEEKKIYNKNDIKMICGKMSEGSLRKPWLTAVYVKGLTRLDFRSSGSLISENLIVTAAQAVAELNNRQIRKEEIVVRVGAYDLENWEAPASLKSVKEITFHPKFDRSSLILKDNIVLLRISPVKFNAFLSPVCLIPSRSNILSVVGFATGWVSDENHQVTSIPTTTQMQVIDNNMCIADHQSLKVLTSATTLCACGLANLDYCYEDQGRGLTLMQGNTKRWYLSGLLSYSLMDLHAPGTCKLLPCRIFTDLTKYSDWIDGYL